MFDAFKRFTEDVNRAYGEFDKNYMGGLLPGGAARSTIPAAPPRPVTTSTPQQSARGEGRAAFQQLTPMESAPIGQPMILNGIQGYKHADGTWREGTPDGATLKSQPKGMINIPTKNNDEYAKAGFVKSLTGVFGMPFNIEKPQSQVDFENETKNTVTRRADGTIVFNRDESIAAGNEEQYNNLGNDLGNKVLGRYESKQNEAGTDVANDQFDTNQTVGWHFH